ncbi:MAG: heme o synthase [Minisyncoccia bacterium]
MKNYLELAKPGIVLGNLLPAAAGFLLISRGAIDWARGAALIAGLALVIASACATNNYIDRDIDTAMARTKGRPTASGTLSAGQALGFAAISGSIGFLILYFGANALAAELALFGWFAYVVLYSLLAKRRTIYNTLVGAISGAMPPVIGCAAAGFGVGPAAFILFASLVFWQMPHFYAIAMYRAPEYAAAGVPTMPAARGMRFARLSILLYIILFALTAPLLWLVGAEGAIYAAAMAIVGLAWFVVGIASLQMDAAPWARRMFFCSLIVILVFSVFVALGATFTLP